MLDHSRPAAVLHVPFDVFLLVSNNELVLVLFLYFFSVFLKESGFSENLRNRRCDSLFWSLLFSFSEIPGLGISADDLVCHELIRYERLPFSDLVSES